MAITYLSGERTQGTSVDRLGVSFDQDTTTDSRTFGVGSRKALGVKISAGHYLVGKTITQFQLVVNRDNDGAGTVRVYVIRDGSGSGGNDQEAVSDAVTVPSSTSGATTINTTFTFSGGVTIVANDIIAIVRDDAGALTGVCQTRTHASDTDSNAKLVSIDTTSSTSFEYGDFSNLGTNDDLRYIATGVSAVIPTNVPVGTRFEETDTRKIFRMKLVPTNTGFTDWTNNSTSSIAVASNVATVTPSPDNTTMQGLSYDVGTANIGSTWTLQFILDVVSYSTNSTCAYYDWGIWVSDNNSATTGDSVSFGVSNTTCSPNSIRQGYALKVANGTAYRNWLDADSSNVVQIKPTQGTSYTVPSTTQGAGSDGKLGVRLMRMSSTAFRLELWNNTDFSGSATITYNTSDTTLCGNLTGLRYIVISSSRQSGYNGANTGTVSELKFYNGSITNPPVASTPAWTEKGTA